MRHNTPETGAILQDPPPVLTIYNTISTLMAGLTSDPMKNRIAVSFQGNDCLRIIPMPAKSGNAEIKFHFFDDSFIIRKFDFNNEIGGLIYIPKDHGKAEHEISYHSANEHHPTPVILPKYKDDKIRTAVSNLKVG